MSFLTTHTHTRCFRSPLTANCRCGGSNGVLFKVYCLHKTHINKDIKVKYVELRKKNNQNHGFAEKFPQSF